MSKTIGSMSDLAAIGGLGMGNMKGALAAIAANMAKLPD